MAKKTKRAKQIQEALQGARGQTPEEVIDFLKKLPPCKFDQSLDLVIRLGIDARKGDQMVRGLTSLPGGSGKKVRVAAFVEGDDAKQAKAAGADVVGMEDLSESMQKGDLNYDLVIATPVTMKLVGRLGKILGPKGLMPNPKDGTVTDDIAATVKAAKAGQARFRNEKAGVIHCSIGKLSNKTQALVQNFYAVLNEVQRLKPKSSKGIYLRSVFLSPTMGPALAVNPASNS